MAHPTSLHTESDARVLRLKRGEDRRLAAGHLWVFSNEVDTDSTPLTGFAPGAVAELRSARDAFMGWVCVNPHALICARILSRELSQRVDRALLERRLAAALALRERLGTARHCRWVFGESDLAAGAGARPLRRRRGRADRHGRHGGAQGRHRGRGAHGR